MNPNDLFEQFTAISKASAYDAIIVDYNLLKGENVRLKARVKELENLISEYTSKMLANLSGPKVDKFLKDQLTDNDDIKDINI